MNREEIFEIVDEEGRIIGQATRSHCHRDPSLLHRSVHVFVLNGRNEIFLQKRSQHKDIQPGKWDTSVGGHVSPGESPLAAARREMAEELGIEGAELSFLHRYLWRTAVESELVHTYQCYCEGPFLLQTTEIEAGRFVQRQELKPMADAGQLTPNLIHELTLLFENPFSLVIGPSE